MIHVIATIELRAGTRPAYLEEFARLTPHVRQEAGCLEYGAVVDCDCANDGVGALEPRPDTVIILERWLNLDAWNAHLTAPHMTDYRRRTKDYVIGRTLQVLEPTD